MLASENMIINYVEFELGIENQLILHRGVLISVIPLWYIRWKSTEVHMYDPEKVTGTPEEIIKSAERIDLDDLEIYPEPRFNITEISYPRL